MSELKEKMKAWAKAKEIKLGRYGLCSHSQGLPSVPDSLEVKPNYNPDGDCSLLLVTPHTIQRFSISTPYDYTHWYASGEEVEYESLDELEALVKSMIDPPAKAWED